MARYVKALACVCRASSEVPVTTVPTGNVKLHQARLKGGRALSVSVAASANHKSVKPMTGTP